jgi:hypothetical protein
VINAAPPFFATPGGQRQPTPADLQHYALHKYQASMQASADTIRAKDQPFAASGFYLSVVLLSGPDLLGVSIGAKDNPYIPVREGMVIGPVGFDEFRVRLLSKRKGAFPVSPETIALFATSWGPLLTDPGFKRKFFEPGAWTVTTDVDNTPTDLLDPTNMSTLWAMGAGTPKNVPALLRWGGTLRIHNRDAAIPVFIYFGKPNVIDAQVLPIIGVTATLDQVAWQIDPGQKEEFTFESGIRWAKKGGPFANDRAFDLSLFAQTADGTARVAVMFGSPLRDLSDADVDPDIGEPLISLLSP